MLIILAVWLCRCGRALRLRRADPLADESLLAPPDPAPFVSVVIAARDEERSIGECLCSLRRQEYDGYEIIVADDSSADRTPEIVRKEFPSVNCLRVPLPPAGAAGKSHALSFAAARARGEWLLFTDADTVHSPRSIRVPLSYALRHDLQMLSLLPGPSGGGFWENLLQPVIGIFLFIVFPIERVNRRGSRTAFANGQYILISRRAYDRVGGHEAVRAFPLEDIALAQNVKRAGLGLALLVGGDLLRCRMYRSLGEIWSGWLRIFFLIFSDAAWLLPLLAALVALLSLLPYAGLVLWPPIAVAQIALIHLAAERTYAYIGADRRTILLHPVGCAILIAVLLGAFWRRIRGTGVAWKGRRYTGQPYLRRR